MNSQSNVDDTSSHLGILIDADNARPLIVQGLLAEVAKFGTATIRRIYGDWTTPNLAAWKAVLLDHSIQPIQQFRYTTGKNATDSALIIDAMDLLYAGNLDGFCIVSSDSDFTRLASRLREAGKRVYGFGEQKTPRPFVAACDRFIYTEVFSHSQGGATKRHSTAQLQKDKALVGAIAIAIEAVADDAGWAHLGAVGSALLKNSPDFDARSYGYSRLGDLLEGIKLFRVERTEKGAKVRLAQDGAS